MALDTHRNDDETVRRPCILIRPSPRPLPDYALQIRQVHFSL